MKKMLVFFCVLFCLTVPLCSCEVHVGTTRYDVAWWVIAIPVTLIFAVTFAVCFFVIGKAMSRRKYVCPECRKGFFPKRWAVFCPHAGDTYILKCPHCGRKGFCRPSRHKEDEA